MKSVSFLRNTFKKWEQKANLSDDKQSTNGSDSTSLSRSSSRKEPLSARSLNITVKQLPLLPPEPLTAATIDGSWGTPYPDSYGPSLISTTGHTRNCSLTGEIPYIGKSTTYRKFSVSSTDILNFSSSGRNGKTNKSHLASVEHHDFSTRSSGPSWPALTRKFTTKLSSNSTFRRVKGPLSRPPSPQSPSSSSFPLLPPIDLERTHVKFDSFSSTKKRYCQCSANHTSDCPRYIHLETQTDVVSSNVGDDVLKSPPKSVHAVDLLVGTKPRRLYHNSGSSTPHLPYDGRGSPSPPSLGATSSIDGEAGNFPLSLFPAPPPLIVRKKVPSPLVLRPSPPPRSAQSSRDSTPLGTPTTPRFQQVYSPSQLGIASPTKKAISRPTASITPPKYSPPNSPLPEIPTIIPGYERQRTASAQIVRPPRPVRSFSNNNLRDTITSFSVNQRHRLTSSEPISDHSSLPIKRSSPPKPRPAPLMLQTRDLKSHVEITNSDQAVTPSGTVESVQWGYAF
ncbi:hypothetical protein BJ165DRAFT_1521364 [Panaeolus papilionaceus]|nr:hypothetical protein BJ165DRAFT_1521364 [Panaeolus papilionaceus]